MTQTYSNPTAIERMREGLCPECGEAPGRHTQDPRFWMPRDIECDLTVNGVIDRIAKHHGLDKAL